MALPQPFSNIPFQRLSYAQPSPIHLLPGLTQRYNQTVVPSSLRLWTKREDQAGLLAAYGNKYRKFEYIIPDIFAQQQKIGKAVTTLVTEGALQSNHTVQVASLARVLNLKCTVLLHKGIGGLRDARNQEGFLNVGNVQLCRMLGANVVITDESDTGDEKGPLIPILHELSSQGEMPYWISSGASLHPLGGLGYASCAFEITRQEQSMAEEGTLDGSRRFDYIFVACGSGSTLAGLIAGFKLREKTSPPEHKIISPHIIGVMTSPTKSISYQQERILRLARNTGKLIGLDTEDIMEEDVHLEDRFVGEAYGILDKDTAEVINLAVRTDSLLLDPVYTGKVMRGLLHWAEAGLLRSGSNKESDSQNRINVLFIHTGGQNALNAYADHWSPSIRGR